MMPIIMMMVMMIDGDDDSFLAQTSITQIGLWFLRFLTSTFCDIQKSSKMYLQQVSFAQINKSTLRKLAFNIKHHNMLGHLPSDLVI